MATIHNLVASGELIRFDPHLGPNELELRLIHITPKLRQWLQEDLPKLVPRWTTQISPTEQLSQLFDEFCGGTALYYPNTFHPMIPVNKGIWELKTRDIRIFGWFHVRDCFIAVEAADATEVKKSGYGPYINRAVISRINLNLDHPNHIMGNNPDDVVSNCYPA